MRGIVKLKVPTKIISPKLFVITLSRNDVQKKFQKIAYDLNEAITKCYFGLEPASIHNYINHVELSVDEINSLFKNF